MIGYLDWAQDVARVVLRERPNTTLLTIPALATELGLAFEGGSDEERNELTLNLDRVLNDLVPFQIVEYESAGFTIGYPAEARRFRRQPLSSLWPGIRSHYLDPEDEEFLAALAGLSERPGTHFADVAIVDAKAVLSALGWAWDGPRAHAISGHLRDQGLAIGSEFPGYSIHSRVTYAGLVRAQPAAGTDPELSIPRLRRLPGRPKGSRLVTRDQIEATYRQLRTQYGRPPTQSELCSRLDPRIEVRTLRAALTDYGLPWPIE